MKMKWLWMGVMAAVCSCSLWAVAEGDAAKEVRGTVQEGGFGKFRLQDKSDTSWLFYLSKDGSSYQPDDWRPTVGDEVSVAYMTVQKRNASIAQVTRVTLIKVGPNTVRIKSPVQVEITEVGRSGYKAKVLPAGTIVRFASQRSTQTIPVGWAPQPGDKATITFTTKPTMGFMMSYAMDKVEKAEAGATPK
jgi:hypothetical protein